MDAVHSKKKIALTGATGMIGEGVLRECIAHGGIESVIVIGRRPCGTMHPKVKELLVKDLTNLDAVGAEIESLDACIFCAGTTPLGRTEDEYHRLTVSLTKAFCEDLIRHGFHGTLCYVSAQGADPDGREKSMWRRVKGQAEVQLSRLPLSETFFFRPAVVRATKGLKHAHPHYRIMDFLVPLIDRIFPESVVTLSDLGLAMIHAVRVGAPKNSIEVRDIRIFAGLERASLDATSR